MEMRNNLFCSGNGDSPLPPEIKRCPAPSLKYSSELRDLCCWREG